MSLFLRGGWVVKFLTLSHFCHMSFLGGGGWVLKEIWSMSLNNPVFFLTLPLFIYKVRVQKRLMLMLTDSETVPIIGRGLAHFCTSVVVDLGWLLGDRLVTTLVDRYFYLIAKLSPTSTPTLVQAEFSFNFSSYIPPTYPITQGPTHDLS